MVAEQRQTTSRETAFEPRKAAQDTSDPPGWHLITMTRHVSHSPCGFVEARKGARMAQCVQVAQLMAVGGGARMHGDTKESQKTKNGNQ